MKNPKKLLNLAAKMARLTKDNRSFCLGAVAIRNDDVMVYAYNGHARVPEPAAHCEARLARKLDKGATVYLVRLTKDGEWAMSKPCVDCMRALRRKDVNKIYYSIGPKEWASLTF